MGCLIGGAWRLDPVVAQGCRPIGPVFEIERAERNVVQRLSSNDGSGTPVACLQAILETLTPQERDLVRHSLFLGVARNSFQLASGTEASEEPAFLVRNLIGVDPAPAPWPLLSACGWASRCSSSCGMPTPPARNSASCCCGSNDGRPNPWPPCCSPASAAGQGSTASPTVM